VADKPQVALYDRHSREEEAELALKRTKLTPAVAWTLTAALLAIIFGEPLLQGALDVSGRRAAGGGSALPQAFEAVRLCPGPHWADRATAASGEAPRGPRRWWAMLPPVKAIKDFEEALERNSAVGRALLPRVQVLMTRLGGVGNEQAYVGRDGWLFYRPEVDALLAPGFLEPAQLRRRERGGDSSSEAVQPDPVKALAQFDRELRARGVALIVMPAPMKPSIHPERLSGRYAPDSGPLYNRSYARFLEEMKRYGIPVFDVSGDLAAAQRATGRPQFLETDTHWTPEAMELAAGKLAEFIAARHLLPAREPAGYTAKEAAASTRGDIEAMLKLPAGRRAFRAQQVAIHPVFRPDGGPWQPDRGSDVLVLGDSFFNIYSLDTMNWGAGAGFVEQLSLRLQRPLDRITVNAGGSHTTRQELAKASQRDRLAGKRLVIYEFAMRDLSVGDWKLLALPAPSADGPKAVPSPPPGVEGELEVEGRVQQIGSVPKPGTVPYKDCLVGVHLKDVRVTRGSLKLQELGVYTWGMKDNQWTAAATARPGQVLRLALTPWTQVEAKYQRYNKAEPAGDMAGWLDLDAFYGEERK
jgi:alginate O-acetyltransferase complex protein AlgJ